jgi:hypothetical protein
MNSKIEACRECPTQCIIEDRTAKLIELFNSDGMDLAEIKDKVGKISQKARTIKCPSSEIERIRRYTYRQIAPGQYVEPIRLYTGPISDVPHYNSGNYVKTDSGATLKKKGFNRF